MCGDLRRNFEEIPSLPEHTAEKLKVFTVKRGKKSSKWLCRFVDTLRQAQGLPFFCGE